MKQYVLWFSSGLRAVVPGDQLALLPEGTALIERQEREDAQIDHLVSVSQDNCRKQKGEFILVPIRPCLSLPVVQSFQYIGDELHRHGAYDPDPYLVVLFGYCHVAIAHLFNAVLD